MVPVFIDVRSRIGSVARYCSASSYRDSLSSWFVKLVSRRGNTKEVYPKFPLATQSRAGLSIVSVHEWHHHKHLQSRHVDTPVGFGNGLNTGMCVSLASAFKRTKSENTSFAAFHRSQVPSFFGSLLHINR